MKLDDKDQLLLDLLTHNARSKNQDLAQKVGLSPSACLARVRRLEASGAIVGYRAIVSRRHSGARFEGWASIRLTDPSPQTADRLIDLIKTTPEIVEAHRIAGHYDYAVRICAGDIDTWNRFRRSLSEAGCEAQATFSLLIEPLK